MSRLASAVAAELDRWWDLMGRPDPYVVVEDGAENGQMAASLLAAGLGCAPALRYLLVEPAPGRRAAQPGRVALEPPAELLGPVLAGTGDSGDDPVPLPGIGPLFASLAELPRGLDLAVVFRLGLPATGPGIWLDAARRVAADGLAVVIAPATGRGGAGPAAQRSRWQHPLDGFPHLEVVAWGLGWVDRRS